MILRSNPNSRQALLLLIKAYSDSGEERLAIEAYRNYLDVDRDNDAIRVEFARRLMLTQKIDEAENMVSQILRRSPRFVPALLLQIDQHIIRKYWAGAIEIANLIIREAADEIEGRTALGKIYLAQGRLKEAIIELKRVSEVAPGSSQARSMLIRAFLKNDQADQAIDVLRKNVTTDPGDADAFVLLADVYFQLNRTDDAKEALVRSLKAPPDSDLPYLKLITLHIKTDRQVEAIEAARAGLKAIPNHVRLLINLGMIEDARGERNAARE